MDLYLPCHCNMKKRTAAAGPLPTEKLYEINTGQNSTLDRENPLFWHINYVLALFASLNCTRHSFAIAMGVVLPFFGTVMLRYGVRTDFTLLWRDIVVNVMGKVGIDLPDLMLRSHRPTKCHSACPALRMPELWIHV